MAEYIPEHLDSLTEYSSVLPDKYQSVHLYPIKVDGVSRGELRRRHATVGEGNRESAPGEFSEVLREDFTEIVSSDENCEEKDEGQRIVTYHNTGTEEICRHVDDMHTISDANIDEEYNTQQSKGDSIYDIITSSDFHKKHTNETVLTITTSTASSISLSTVLSVSPSISLSTVISEAPSIALPTVSSTSIKSDPLLTLPDITCNSTHDSNVSCVSPIPDLLSDSEQTSTVSFTPSYEQSFSECLDVSTRLCQIF